LNKRNISGKNIKVNYINSIYNKVQTLIYNILTLMIESKILISLSSTFFIIASCSLIDRSYLSNFDKLHYILYILFFISTLVIYNLHKKYNSLILFTKSIQQHKLIHKITPAKFINNKALLASFGILVVVTLFLFVLIDLLSNRFFVDSNHSIFNIIIFFVKFLLPIGIISLLYSIPFFPDYRKKYINLSSNNDYLLRLKDLPFIKLFLISFVWAYNSILPIYIQEYIYHPDIIPNYFDFSYNYLVLLIFLQNLIFVIAITLPFDIRDKAYDKERGIITIPNYFDLNSNNVSIILMIIVILFSISSYLLFNIYSITQLLILTIFDIRIIFTLKKYIFNNENSVINQELNSIKRFTNFWQKYYFYGVLDGVILIRSFLILLFAL